MNEPMPGQIADRAAFIRWFREARSRWWLPKHIDSVMKRRLWECWQAAQEYGLEKRGCCQEEPQDEPG